MFKAVLESPVCQGDKLSAVDGVRRLAEGLQNGAFTEMTAARELEGYIKSEFPHTWAPKKERDGKKHTNREWSRKRMRRAQYAVVQTLYTKSRKDAANLVLSGDWATCHLHERNEPPSNMLEYWKELFEAESVEDKRPVIKDRSIQWQILDPITVEEVKEVAVAIGKSAAGLDRVGAASLWKQPSGVTQLLNLLLLLEFPSMHLSKGRVTLIPKVKNPKGPTDFRPIAVASVILRTLHKILARRWLKVMKLDSLQLAFQRRDGCLEASELLQTVIRNAHCKSQSLAAAFVDVSKAFDTVSTNTILRAAQRQGLPPPFVSYLKRLYEGSSVQLLTTTIRCGRGVRQGDPLSPLLFNAVMDEVIGGSLPLLGVEVGGRRIGALAYADDLVLFAENESRLKDKLVALNSALQAAGMAINASKSCTLTITSNTHQKTVALQPTRSSIGGESLKPLSVDDKVTYLGLTFNWKGLVRMKHTRVLEENLNQLRRAPLKPYQRLTILKHHLIPRLNHELVLGFPHRNTLKSMDVMIRGAVRGWLRLPSDTTLAYMYTKVAEGGLGLPCLSTTIPLAQRKRLEKIAAGVDLLANTVKSSESFRVLLRSANLPVRVGGEVACSKQEAEIYWKRTLYRSCDGRGLEVEAHPSSYDWIGDPSRIPSRVFLRSLKLRGGLLPTKVRAARRRPGSNVEVRCKNGCGLPESVDHITQVCHVTHDVRCERHNRIAKKVGKAFEKLGAKVWFEPTVLCGPSFCKPDLVVKIGESLSVMDVCITTARRIDQTKKAKIEKYGMPEIEQGLLQLAELPPSSKVRHVPVVLTNRGLIDRKCGMRLQRMGIHRRVLGDLAVTALLGSLKCYDLFMRGTRRY
ncbi:unnamed protein product [Echinostoma caproni]|uniref:Reverse transcriptase domain-containing protein n=1 Tax=Echinostoma caproni TaxID=27848 RepID=A0A183A234_9TREM|nr:unnamed protein product [Echinostoma caproni]